MLAELALMLAIEPRLEVPWACETTYTCTQGNEGATSHVGYARYAWDFGLPLGTEIAAAHSGTVAQIRMDSRRGGCSQTFVDDANYIVIDHGDGTAGLYLHLEAESSSLEIGDAVEAGEVIGRVGRSGWTCGPHLHFQVQELCGSWWCQSVPAEFRGVGVIAEGESMTSESCDGRSREVVVAAPRQLAGRLLRLVESSLALRMRGRQSGGKSSSPPVRGQSPASTSVSVGHH